VQNIIVNHFYADTQILSDVGQSVHLNWHITGAANIAINGSFNNLAEQGSLILQPKQTTDYTITAIDSTQRQLSQTLRVIVTAPIENSNPWHTGAGDVYIAPIESSMFIDEFGNRYFGDLQGDLHKENMDGNKAWTSTGVGQVSSPPLVWQSLLYFTSSTTSGGGKFCSINIAGSTLRCIDIINPIIAAPVFGATKQYAWVIDLHGNLYKVKLSDFSVTEHHPLPAGIRVRSTPVATPSDTLAIRSTDHQLFLLDLTGSQVELNWISDLKGQNDE